MKKKLLLISLMVALFICLLAISVSADEITVVDGTDDITLGKCVIEGLV